jgi:hypothetical protein
MFVGWTSIYGKVSLEDIGHNIRNMRGKPQIEVHRPPMSHFVDRIQLGLPSNAHIQHAEIATNGYYD